MENGAAKNQKLRKRNVRVIVVEAAVAVEEAAVVAVAAEVAEAVAVDQVFKNVFKSPFNY